MGLIPTLAWVWNVSVCPCLCSNCKVLTLPVLGVKFPMNFLLCFTLVQEWRVVPQLCNSPCLDDAPAQLAMPCHSKTTNRWRMWSAMLSWLMLMELPCSLLMVPLGAEHFCFHSPFGLSLLLLHNSLTEVACFLCAYVMATLCLGDPSCCFANLR